MRNHALKPSSGLRCLLLALFLGLAAGCTTVRSSYEGPSALIETAITLVPSATSISSGTAITLNATVNPATASGTVTFYDGSLALGSNPLSSGSAAFPTASLVPGSHTLTATYSGSSMYAPSTSAAITVVVSAASIQPTSITLTASESSSFVGGPPYILTATVVPSSATGTVSFYDGLSGGGTLETFPLNSSGIAVDRTLFAFVGPFTHDLFATYNGSATYAPSLSNQLQFVVTQPSVVNPTLLLSVSPDPAVAGNPVTLTLTIDPATATGPYNIFDDGRLIASGTVSTRTTTFTSTFTAGTHMLLVQFAGAGIYAPGYSNFVILTD